MKRSKKQDEFFEAFKTGKYLSFILAGGAGSAKSIGAMLLVNAILNSIPNSRIPIYRKSETILKNNTIPSFKKVLEMTGCTDSVVFTNLRATYPNGSEALFLWADMQKDPDLNNAKGGEWTGVMFDEINQIEEDYYDIMKSRAGRCNEFEGGNIKPFIIGTCNPTNNWVKSRFYDKWKNGTLDKSVFFQLSLPTDNPFLLDSYFDAIKELPKAQYNRYVLGDWEYNDDVNSLIRYEHIRNCITSDPHILSDQSVEYIGADIARYGDDKSVLTFVQDDFFYGQKEYERKDTVEMKDIIKKEMNDRDVFSSNVAVDAIGLGSGVIDGLIHDGFSPFPFMSSYTSSNSIRSYKFKNLRAEVFWAIRTAFQEGTIRISDNTDLIRELTNIRYEVEDKVISIEKKKAIKKRLGSSPDRADSFAMAFYISHMRKSAILDMGVLKNNPLGGDLMSIDF